MTDAGAGATTTTITTARRGVLAAGMRLRNYEVVSVLGQGAFGVTYLARDTTLGRELAIKEYLPSSIAVRENGTTVLPRSTDVAEEFVWGRDRFLEEARILATLDEATAVVRVFDFLEENGTAYMVMALVRGDTLAQRLQARGVLNFLEVQRLLLPLLDGLAEVHKAGFLHRDIKPANIILKPDGMPILIDFGASRSALAGRTSAMTAIFTPGYAAAEQFTSAKQGPWTDIYGLSATLYHSITGKTPPSAFERMLDDEYVPLARLKPNGFASGLLTGIDAGLAVRATDRPQSISGWRNILTQTKTPAFGNDVTTIMRADVAELKSSLMPLTGDSAPTSPPTAKVSHSRANRLLYGGLAVTTAIAIVGGYLVFSPKLGGAPPTVAVRDLNAEDLRKLLDDRVKADEAATETKRLEQEAQQKADVDAAAKKAADTDLAAAQQRIQKAEQEVARLKAEAEVRKQQDAAQKEQADTAARRAAEEAAQRKAEADIAALRQAEEVAKRKAAVEADAKRQSDEALAQAQAARQKAEEEAATRRKAEEEAEKKAAAEAEARRNADADAKVAADATAKQKAADEARAKTAAETDKKAAEAAENNLKLSQQDRQRLQVALTSLGFDTRGSDGVFGPRSREMISAWQKARKFPETSYLTAQQQQGLLKEATSTVAKFDDDQKKQEDEKKAAEEAKKKAEEEKTKQSVAVPLVPGATNQTAGFDGRWTGEIGGFFVDLLVSGGTAQVTIQCRDGLPATGTASISRDGAISGRAGSRYVSGKLPELNIPADGKYCIGGTGNVRRGAGSLAVPAATPSAVSPSVSSTVPPISSSSNTGPANLFDGKWTATMECSPGNQSWTRDPFKYTTVFSLVHGKGEIKRNSSFITISIANNSVSLVNEMTRDSISGPANPEQITASGFEKNSGRNCSFEAKRIP